MKPAKPRSTTMDEQTFVPDTMRALYHSPMSAATNDQSSLGSEVVFDSDFQTPKPSPSQYLIKVQTAAFSHDELRLAKTLKPPKSIPQVPVHNFCGRVISTPTKDHRKPDGPKFKVDDMVFGFLSYSNDGAAADYVVATEEQMAYKPKNITAAEASTIPLPALTAWQGLFKYAGLDHTNNAENRGHRTSNNLRVLITDARYSEVGTQALQLLRSSRLFPHSRPWICATCSSEDAAAQLRSESQVDGIIVTPYTPYEDSDFDLASVFRQNNWDPVDIVLDCGGDNLFRQAHSPAVSKDGAAVLTAVDTAPVLSRENSEGERDKPRRVFSRFISAEPDGETLALISQMIEEGEVKGRIEEVVDLVNGADFLASNAAAAGGGRRGKVFVLRVNP